MMGPINHNDDVINDDANDDADDNDANDYDEHKWKWLMMRTRLTIWCSNVFPIFSSYFQSLLIIIPKSFFTKWSKYTGANPGSSDLRLVSPLPLQGDDDDGDYGDGGHKYADHDWS